MTNRLPLPAAFADGTPTLRPPTARDVDRITEVCQDPDIQRFTRVPVPYRREDAQGFVEMAAQALEDGNGAHLLVEVDGALTGCVGASIDHTDLQAAVGYWTAAEARARGVTSQAVARLCRWLLDDVGLARLESDIAADNDASNALAERLGFRLEGTRRAAMRVSAVADLPAERVDVHVWGLLPGELRDVG